MSDLVDLLEELGVEITLITDRRIHGVCPMHEAIKGRRDNKPSWSIDKELRVHHCWSCGYKGTLRSLVIDTQGMEAGEALEWLRSYDLLWMENSLKPRRTRRPVLEPYRAPQGLLKGFEDPPDSALAARQLERFAVAHYGVRWDPAERAWITPVRRENGELLGYQLKSRRKFRNRPKRIPKRETLFGIEVFPEGQRAVLVESPLDVVRLYSEGIAGGLASFGVIVDDRQLALIREHTDELVLALDNDEAGELQRNVLIERLWYDQGIQLSVLDYTGSTAKDIGEMSSEEIHTRLAEPLSKFDLAVKENVFRL